MMTRAGAEAGGAAGLGGAPLAAAAWVACEDLSPCEEHGHAQARIIDDGEISRHKGCCQPCLPVRVILRTLSLKT